MGSFRNTDAQKAHRHLTAAFSWLYRASDHPFDRIASRSLKEAFQGVTPSFHLSGCQFSRQKNPPVPDFTSDSGGLYRNGSHQCPWLSSIVSADCWCSSNLCCCLSSFNKPCFFRFPPYTGQSQSLSIRILVCASIVLLYHLTISISRIKLK